MFFINKYSVLESNIKFNFVIKSKHINKKLKLNIDLLTDQNLVLPCQDKNNTFNDYLSENNYLNNNNITEMYNKYKCYNLNINIDNIRNISDLYDHNTYTIKKFPLTKINDKYSNNMNKKIKNKIKNIILEEYYSKIFNHNLLNDKNFN
ncbi:hypothetical protein NAPIS_ORF00428 [Vairimorpha apis BRL 01]|uniref:Uncharacterized protein n=1 Tax=Vairimorpha apis BRL 01 TaxID=1037528 RepID=T0MFY6_9MICR|nr:hypothetical protein NAPIS_ORF00428 [Vairimorpha apis BRL 01]